MITEDYVSFEIAKLLKEKGFDVECDCFYVDGELVIARGGASNWNIGETLFTDYKNECSAPTLQMTMKWLRKKHKLYIVIRPYVTEEGFFSLFDIKSLKEKEIVVNLRTKTGFNTHEEACEAAIKYCLENLI